MFDRVSLERWNETFCFFYCFRAGLCSPGLPEKKKKEMRFAKLLARIKFITRGQVVHSAINSYLVAKLYPPSLTFR